MKEFKVFLSELETKLGLNKNELILTISDFQLELNDILLPFDKTKQDKTLDFDLILMQYIELYLNLKSPDIAKNQTYPNIDNNQFLYLTMLMLFKNFIHDFITLRNCYTCNFEAQFNSTFRNLFEKFKIFVLCMYDKDFIQEYTFNTSMLSSKERYDKYFSPKRINKRINDNINKLKQSINTHNKIDMSTSFALTAYKLFNDITREVYKVNSLFVHYNDGNELLKYYDEGGEFNISLYNGASKYFKYRVSYAIESLVVYFSHFQDFFEYATNDKQVNKKSSQILIEFLGYIIENNYK